MPTVIILTLGRTQPPHKAHINMLMNAYLRLQPGQTLIHLVGSSNIDPISTGKNILSFEEREDIFVTCLQQALEQKLGRNIVRSELLAQFKCKALPDQTDNATAFPTEEMLNSRLNALAKAKLFFDTYSNNDVQLYAGYPPHSSWKAKLKERIEEQLYGLILKRRAEIHDNKWGMYFIKDASGNALTKIDSRTGQARPVYGHGLNYIAWGINTLNLLKQSLPASADGSVPEVIYEVCGKDSDTQEYIDLLDFLAQYYRKELGFNFRVRLTPIETANHKAMNATQIRSELLAMAQRGLSLKDAKEEVKKNTCSSLNFLPDYSFQVAYTKMCRLIANERQGTGWLKD